MRNEEFVKEVMKEMRRIGEEHAIRGKGDQFAILFATKILMEDEEKVVNEYHIGGRGDEKIDIGICDEDHDVNFVIQCKFSEKPLQTTFTKDLIDEVINAVKRIKEIPDEGKEKRRDFAHTFNLSLGKYTRKIAVGFGRIDDPGVREYARKNDIEIYDFNKLKDRYIYCITPGARRAPEFVDFSNISSIAIERKTKPDFTLYSFLVSLKNIFDLMLKYKDNIFEENLRYRLVRAEKSRIGKEIQRTVEQMPSHFSILNNGVTFVARRANLPKGRKELRAYAPQIVNGCQTCWAIYLAGENLKDKNELQKLDNGKVLIKVVETEEAELVSRTREATNSQNPIDARDLKSGHPYQTELRAAFDRRKPKILYDHREGLLEELQRRGADSHYRITGKTYRIIHNKKCGQYCLALMGKPGPPKAHPKWIFENDAFHETIFNFKQQGEKRFSNDEIGIRSNEVKLRTGQAKFFVEDIIFAHAINNLTTAYAKKYVEKLRLFSENELERGAGATLSKEKRYLEYWHFHVLSALNYVIERLIAGDEKVRKTIRQALIGRDINTIWTVRGLAREFNLNEDKESYVILNENNPSRKFKLFGKWISSLDHFMWKTAQDELKSGRWRSWKDFDLKENTHVKFIQKIENVLGGPTAEREKWFPLPAS